MNTRILVVDDDPNAVNLISLYLKGAGWDCPTAASAAEAARLLQRGDISLVLLDEALPQSGAVFRLCGEQNALPVIMTNERDCAPERIAALDRGADDYLVKPFAFEELLARIRVLTRKNAGNSTNVFSLADLSLDRKSRIVKRGESIINLSAKEYDILEYLLINKGIILSREKIENHVWNFDYSGGTNVVDVYIRYLRKKIDDGYALKLIHTVRGMGYVMREE